MNIYEFITPSDPITFKADDDKVAFTCALLLGNGKAGCTNLKTGDSIPTMLMFAKDPYVVALYEAPQFELVKMFNRSTSAAILYAAALLHKSIIK